MNPTPQQVPLLERSIDVERLILSALVLTAWALTTIARELLWPLLRWALRWPVAEPVAPSPEPAPPMFLPHPTPELEATRRLVRQLDGLRVLGAMPTEVLRRMAWQKRLDAWPTGTRSELIEALLDAGVTRENSYSVAPTTEPAPHPYQPGDANVFLDAGIIGSSSPELRRVVLGVTSDDVLCLIARKKGLNTLTFDSRDELIEAILDADVTAQKSYAAEVPTPAQRNRARGFL